MSLDGRGGQGLWEPKITNGYGYTVAANQGIPHVIDVGVTDVVNANITSSKSILCTSRSLLHEQDGPKTSDECRGLQDNARFQRIRREWRSHQRRRQS